VCVSVCVCAWVCVPVCGVCEIGTSKTRRPRPNLGCFATEERSVTCRASPNFLISSVTDCNILCIPAVKSRAL